MQTTALVNYLSLTGKSFAPSAFYERFTLGFAEVMREDAQRAIAGVRNVARRPSFSPRSDALLGLSTEATTTLTQGAP